MCQIGERLYVGSFYRSEISLAFNPHHLNTLPCEGQPVNGESVGYASFLRPGFKDSLWRAIWRLDLA